METKKVTAERDKTKNVIAEIIIRALCRNAWGFNFASAFVFSIRDIYMVYYERETLTKQNLMEEFNMKKLVNFMLNAITVMTLVSSVYCAEGTTLMEKVVNSAANSTISYETALIKVNTGKVQF